VNDQLVEGPVSEVGSPRNQVGDLVSSWDGKHLALSFYDEDKVELYNFDKGCGKVSFERSLNKLSPADDRPHGMCFAPDDKSLYVTWSYKNSRIAQYPLATPGTIYNIMSYPENINDVEVATNGNMYINVHENGIPSGRIHRIPNPNAVGGGNRSTLDAIGLPIGSSGSFSFPNFLHSTDVRGCEDVASINTLLGDEYHLCDLESETTVLDAGKGFKHYKWTPTGDTTQWIIVKELGEYVVVVETFNGCIGLKNSKVKRRCDLSYHIPNAFTPNKDNLNQTFKAIGEHIESQVVTIYNRWGEKLYEGPEWTGQNIPSGVYAYTIEIAGYQQKRLITRQEKGTVTLLK
jgi:gliding motility-associated-like protein